MLPLLVFALLPGVSWGQQKELPSGEQKSVERLQQLRVEERQQKAEMVPVDVRQALADLDAGQATQAQRALLFKNNDLVNRAGIVGAIDKDSYQSAQRDYAAINRFFGKRAVEATGGVFDEQKRDANKPYDPGTDSDYIAKVSSAEQVDQIQRNYNADVNAWLQNHQVLDQPRSDWHRKLDTDFMADPDHQVSEAEFREISHKQNAAYATRAAARAEALGRMTPAERQEAGVADGKMPLTESTAYVQELDRLGHKKADLTDQALNGDAGNREALRSDPNARAELHKAQAQEQKYTQRKQETGNRLQEERGLAGPVTGDRPEITAEDRKFTEELAQKRKQEALAQGMSEAEAEQAEGKVLKSLEQNDRPVEKPFSALPGEAAKRAPENLGKAQVASALGGHLSKQATNGYSQTLAEYAGKDPSVAHQTQTDIAELSKDHSASEKAEVIERSRQQYAKGMKNELLKTLDPETASRIADDQADGYARGLAAKMRGDKGVAGPGGASYAPGTPGDVAVFGPRAKVTAIDNRETPAGASVGLDESDVIGIAQSAYATGEKLGDAAQATLKQKEELRKRQDALDAGDPSAALRHQQRATQYGDQAWQSMGDAVVEGLNGVPLDKLSGLEGNEHQKSAVSLGDYTKSAYETGKNYGEAALSLYKSNDYQRKAAEAEARGEERVADQSRRLAADANLRGVTHGIEGIRETPIIGGGFKLGEAHALHQQAALLRERAGQAVQRGDLNAAQQLNAQAAQTELKKQERLKGALDNIPLFGATAKKYGELGAEYGAIQQQLGDAHEYQRKSAAARAAGDTSLAGKYDALAAKLQNQAYQSLTKTIESTPVAGTMQELARALVALKQAGRERDAAELARQAGDEVTARRHEHEALLREQEAGRDFDQFKEQAPSDLAAILAVASSYGPHAIMLAAAYKGARHTIENTESGQRLEEAKTEGLVALLETARQAGQQLRGEGSDREQADAQVARLQEIWLRKLDSHEIELRTDVSREQFLSAIALMKSANRKAASLADLGLLDAYVQVTKPKPEQNPNEQDDGWGTAKGGFLAGHGPEAGWGEGDFAAAKPDDSGARIARIIALSERCAYQDAYALARSLQADKPDNVWVNSNLPAIGEWARRENKYHQAIGDAVGAVQEVELDQAIAALQRAMANAATSCQQDVVVRQLLDKALALANDSGRRAAIARAKEEWRRNVASGGLNAKSGEREWDTSGLVRSLGGLMQSLNGSRGGSGGNGLSVDDIYRNYDSRSADEAARLKSRSDPASRLPAGFHPAPGPAAPRTGVSVSQPAAVPAAPTTSQGTGEFTRKDALGDLWNCNAAGKWCRYDNGWRDSSGRVFSTKEEMFQANGWK